MYQGHAEQEQTDTYAFHDITPFLCDDAQLLRKWIEEDLKNNPASPTRDKIFIGTPRRSRPKRRRSKPNKLSWFEKEREPSA